MWFIKLISSDYKEGTIRLSMMLVIQYRVGKSLKSNYIALYWEKPMEIRMQVWKTFTVIMDLHMCWKDWPLISLTGWN